MPIARLWDTAYGDRLVNLPGPLGTQAQGVPIQLIGITNLAGTTDPGVNNDVTTGVSVGGAWFNTTAGQLRWWECRSNNAGAAAWVFSGADYTNGGTNPNTEVTQFGLGTASCAAEGNINRQIVAPPANVASTGNDVVLALYSLPASSFDSFGRGINIVASGSLGQNTNTKTLKIIWGAAGGSVGGIVNPAGSTTIASLSASTGSAGGGWQMTVNVFKYGAAGSNTQMAIHETSQSGNAVSSLVSPSLLTSTENANILIAITGNAATVVSDITFAFLEVNGMN